MGPLAVVDPKPSVGQGAQFRQGFEEARVQHLGPVAPIETFDIGVLVRLAGLDVVATPCSAHQATRGWAVNSGP